MRKNNLQAKVLSLLAIEKKRGNPILLTSYIKNKLKINTGQMSQTKRILVRKGLVDGPSGKLSLKGRYSFAETETKKFRNKRCSHLTTKRRRDNFCPVKQVFVEERHMCGCMESINYSNRGVKHEPCCNGWMMV